jgi:hypothetical protein
VGLFLFRARNIAPREGARQPAARARLIEGGFEVVVKVAATNKCLAQSNKSRTRGPASNKTTGSAAHSSGAANRRGPRCGVSALLVFQCPLTTRVRAKLNMNWHHPDLYLFLCLLAGFAMFLAIVYECIVRRRKPPVVEPSRSIVDPPSPPKNPPLPPKKYLENVKPLDGLQRDRPRPAAEQFSQLCESAKDLPLKEQASRVDEHFGIFGGARPAKGRDRKDKRR